MIAPKLPIDHAEARYEALAAFGGGSMLAALILPRLLDRVGDRPVMLPAAVAMAVLLLGLAIITSNTAADALWPFCSRLGSCWGHAIRQRGSRPDGSCGAQRDVAPKFYPGTGVWIALLGGVGDGRRRGAFYGAQRQSPSRFEGSGVLGRRAPAELRVWARGVVISAPERQHRARVGQRREQRLVEKLIAQTAVEALDEGVLHRLSGAM